MRGVDSFCKNDNNKEEHGARGANCMCRVTRLLAADEADMMCFLHLGASSRLLRESSAGRRVRRVKDAAESSRPDGTFLPRGGGAIWWPFGNHTSRQGSRAPHTSSQRLKKPFELKK
ncbi:hypothetical protein EYF80_004779 [Liparis tanakae]|uniref:Uncharacterized protein n=1 Tax=Liparis tanakae TaxID=230148 RepID=A0A4Z2J456_9TELE|nr:hypothetical protein EYF80_004779 [Liparis tanakae]